MLYVRGPHVMVGYWRKPEQTAEMIVEGPLPGEKMLCAQDHFTVDEDGFLYFVGRSDDIIKTRGEKVSPIEVENAIFDIEGVKEAAVIGVPDEVLGEAIKAFVVLDEGAELTEQEIIAACRTRLENFMVPRRGRVPGRAADDRHRQGPPQEPQGSRGDLGRSLPRHVSRGRVRGQTPDVAAGDVAHGAAPRFPVAANRPGGRDGLWIPAPTRSAAAAGAVGVLLAEVVLEHDVLGGRVDVARRDAEVAEADLAVGELLLPLGGVARSGRRRR